jgi:hypothetical protein
MLVYQRVIWAERISSRPMSLSFPTSGGSTVDPPWIPPWARGPGGAGAPFGAPGFGFSVGVLHSEPKQWRIFLQWAS